MSAPASSNSRFNLKPSTVRALVVGGVALGAVGVKALVCSVMRKRNRTNPKLKYDLAAQIAALKEIYPRLTREFITDVHEKYAFPEKALERLQEMFDYTIIGGKYWRATLVLNTMQQLAEEQGADIEKTWEGGLVLGWCIEIMQALFLVADDIMDGSQTRRGKPCWYKKPKVQMDAINDTLILESFMWFLINKYFRGTKQHVPLLELFQSVSYQTQMGQMLDLLSQPQGEKSLEVLNGFSLEVYNRIVTFKTAIYTFYLPIAAGMTLQGYTSRRQLAAARQISIELGKKFQIEDDYLDCFGLPENIGKDGTDIKDHKCSWLVVQALSRCSPAQRQLLEAHYGKESPESVERIKQLYRDLQLEQIYHAQEESSKALVEELIQTNADILPAGVFMPVLVKIHGRDR